VTIAVLMLKVSTHAKKQCLGVYLEMPVGVCPYITYPFMLHKVYTLPWNIHIIGQQMFIQLIHCTKEIHSDCCHECKWLLTHQIIEGILYRITAGIHINTAYTFQPIEGLIEIL